MPALDRMEARLVAPHHEIPLDMLPETFGRANCRKFRRRKRRARARPAEQPVWPDG